MRKNLEISTFQVFSFPPSFFGNTSICITTTTTVGVRGMGESVLGLSPDCFPS